MTLDIGDQIEHLRTVRRTRRLLEGAASVRPARFYLGPIAFGSSLACVRW